MSNKKVILIFIFLISLQGLFSFLFPTYDNNYYWSPIEDLGFYDRYSLDSFDNSVLKKVIPLIEDYHLNLDGAGYLLIAHNFPQHYFEGHFTLLTRPIYPILVNIVSRPLHLIGDSYSLTFVAGLIVNFILFFFTVYLFYLLVKKFISSRVAFLSSILLIFSPFAHVWLIQPETNIFGNFAIIFSLYLLSNYAANPFLRKLVIFSLAVGVLMVGKKLFAISFFILLLSFIFKRYKEGIIFFILHLLPLAFWLFWVTQVWKLPFYEDQVSHWGIGVWIFSIFSWPWYQTFQIFINSIINFFSIVVHGFMLIPVIFAPIGYRRLILKKKNIFLSSFILSFFALIFIMNYYVPRHGFWLFPIVFPLAVLGIDEAADFLKKYRKWYSLVFYVIIYSLIILISSLDIYKVVVYG